MFQFPGLGTAVLVGVVLATAPRSAFGAAGTDLYGDPLPPGAVARLGSLRLRHYGLSDMVFSADGKWLISAGADRVVRFWDVATGTASRTVRLQGSAGPGQCVTLSPDGKWLVAFAKGELVFWDVETGKELKRLPGPPSVQYVRYLYFTPDGHTLVVGAALHKVTLWNWKEGTERQLTLPKSNPIVHNGDSSTHACVSPDGKYLATGPHSQDPLCIWDLATGKERHRFDAQAGVSAFSPDCQQLAVASMRQGGGILETVLRLFDVATGKEVFHTSLPGKGFYWWITFSPDGKVIVPVDTEGVYLLDRRTGKEIRRLSGPQTGRMRMVCFSPDGRFLAGAGANRIRLWEAASGKELLDRLGGMENPTDVAWSPDSCRLATGAWIDANLQLWDAGTGRLIWQVDNGRPEGYVRSLMFSADGRTLGVGRMTRGAALLYSESELEFLDAITGKRRRTLATHEAQQPKTQVVEFRGCHLTPDASRVIILERLLARQEFVQVRILEAATKHQVASRSFTPASQRHWARLGARMAFLTADGIMVADGATGQFHLLVPGACQGPLATSPDHQFVAAPCGGNESPAVRVWEASTGKEVATVRTGSVNYLALVPDGRTLVTSDATALCLWDLASGKGRHRWAFPEDLAGAPGIICGLYVSPAGRRATTPLGDGTLLVWELPPQSRPARPEPLDAKQLAQLWTDLADADANWAYAAAWKLTDAPGSAVTLLRQQLKPVKEQDLQRVRQLVQDLDKDAFAVREAAAKELEKLGAVVAPALRQALAANPSLELRRRLEMLLSKMAHEIPTGERLDRLRALRVLEQIGSPEARQVLEVMAGGTPAAGETQEAKACLQRLGR